MKVTDLQRFMSERPGAVIHLKAAWRDRIQDAKVDDEVIAGWFGGVMIRIDTFGFVVSARPGAPDFEPVLRSQLIHIAAPPPRIRSWGLEKLGPGVWSLEPSVVQGALHAYVTLIGVPDPAPWEEVST